MFNNLLDKIIYKLKHLLGLDVNNTHEQYLHDLSEYVTNLFTNTKINVYSIDWGEIPNAFALPNVYHTHGLMLSPLSKIFFIGPFIINIVTTIESLINTIAELPNQLKKQYNISINPKTKKGTIEIPEINVFVTTELLKILNNDEVIAVILHEVGHNTHIVKTALIQILTTSTIGAVVIRIINIYKFNNSDSNNQKIALPIMMGLTILIFLFKLIQFITLKKCELHADTFAVNMGYGKPLKSAILKIDKYRYKSLTKIYKESKNKNRLDVKDKEKINDLIDSIDNINDIGDVHLINKKRIDFLNNKIKDYHNKINKNIPIYQ